MSCSRLLAQLLRSCEHRVDYCDFISLFLIDESDCIRSEWREKEINTRSNIQFWFPYADLPYSFLLIVIWTFWVILQEYKSLRKYVYIFILLPLILSLSRIFKFLNFGLKLMNTNIERTGSAYVYAISFSLNGLFNSMLCFFFFRRAILCCKGN